MDYSKFSEFPFPSVLSEEEERLKSAFLNLSDEAQLELLNGCHSYSQFRERLFSGL